MSWLSDIWDDTIGEIPIIGDILGGAEDYRRSKRLQEREHSLALEYAPAYFKEQQRQSSETWLGEGALGPQVTAAQQEATLGGRIDTVMDRGATLPEALGVGGGSNPQGPTAMLGNGPQQAAGRAMMANQRFQLTMQERDLKTRLQIAGMQYGEGSPAAVSAEAATQQAAVALERVNLQGVDVDTRRRAQALKEVMAEVQREVLTNQAATSHPEFVIYKLALAMGPENLRTSALYNMMRQGGLDVLSKENQNLSPEEWTKALHTLRAEGSHILKEATGISRLLELLIEGSFGSGSPDKVHDRERPLWGGQKEREYNRGRLGKQSR